MNIKYSFIYHMNKNRTIACWSHLLMTYSSEKIPWNFHTSLRSHLKNSCFGFHQAFQTPRNNKSTRPKRPRAFICFSVFGTPDKTLALVVDILLQLACLRKTDESSYSHFFTILIFLQVSGITYHCLILPTRKLLIIWKLLCAVIV